jgi:hypothetical protein
MLTTVRGTKTSRMMAASGPLRPPSIWAGGAVAVKHCDRNSYAPQRGRSLVCRLCYMLIGGVVLSYRVGARLNHTAENRWCQP